MSQFVESLKRLYDNGMLTGKKIFEMYDAGKITGDEKQYILSNAKK